MFYGLVFIRAKDQTLGDRMAGFASSVPFFKPSTLLSMNPSPRWPRFWRRVRRFVSADGFALAPVWLQLLTIFVVSATLIFLLALPLQSLSTSYRIFADPSAYADAEGWTQVVFGLLQVLVGLTLFSFIISVLSAALEQWIERIKGGTLPYRKKGHLLIVNYNAKLPLILDEINYRAHRHGGVSEIVLLFPDQETVELFSGQLDLERWSELEIYVRRGELLHFETYRRLSVQNAFGVVVLAADSTTDMFTNDNLNLKILATLANERTFLEHLLARQQAREPVKFSIELSGEICSREIAFSLAQADGGSLIAVTSPIDVIGSVLSRSIIDIIYYKVYFEIMSFHGQTVQFVSQRQFTRSGLSVGERFENIVLNFSGGVLVGYSRTDAKAGFQLRLCPFGEVLQESDWLLFITNDPSGITYRASSVVAADPSPRITPPSEILCRRLCVVGSAWPVENLEVFLDVQSRASLGVSHFVFEKVEDYFAPDFVAQLRSGAYDNIVINLQDEVGFRLTLHLTSDCEQDDQFLEKIVTVLDDPMIEELLNRSARCKHTILSQKLAAKYIAQLSFQKNLEYFFAELAQPTGVEFNLLEVGRHIPRDLLASRHELRRLLAGHQMIYVGTVDAGENVVFDTENTAEASHILVLQTGRHSVLP
jgi:hypothetical protein